MEQFATEFKHLKEEFARNKYIPARFEREILIALSHYPELKETKIRFIHTLAAAVPYATKPSFMSCFLPKAKREYTITVLDYADGPMELALMKKLTPRMRIGAFGHELGRVVQYDKCDPLSLFRIVALYFSGFLKKKIEHGADTCAIEHGLGEELLEHAEHIHSIPGYVETRPEVAKYYMQPSEIKYYIRHPEELTLA